MIGRQDIQQTAFLSLTWASTEMGVCPISTLVITDPISFPGLRRSRAPWRDVRASAPASPRPYDTLNLLMRLVGSLIRRDCSDKACRMELTHHHTA